MRKATRRKPTGEARRRRFFLEPLEPRIALDSSSLRITEFMADNEDGIVDFQGDASDWIEIFNSGSDAVDLSGLHLSDNRNNLTKWEFPSGVTLEGGEYLVVWASSKNGVYGDGELHTNFSLSADGEYLGLVASDGQTVIDDYLPKFPPQYEDLSYGVAMDPVGNSITVVGAGAQARALIPPDHGLMWIFQELDHDDSAWPITGGTGIGYENSPGHAQSYSSLLSTYVPSNTTSLYVRIEFELDSLAGLDELTLRMKYSDGFVAFLNGEQIAESNAVTPTMFNSVASANRDRADARQWADFKIEEGGNLLRVGKNVLAFHALNVAGSSNMLLLPELVATSRHLVDSAPRGYLGTPTPGYGNDGTAVSGFVAEPAFSVPHGFYNTPQTVALTSHTPGSIIVYTTDGSMPLVDDQLGIVNGLLYTDPLEIEGTTNLRARAFREGFAASPATASTYLFLDDIIHQPEAPLPGWPANGLNGQYMDYGIDPEIVALYGEQAVKDSLAALSVFSITFDLDDMFHPDFGIYVNAKGRGREWERHVNVEFIDPANNTGFEVNAGLRMRGNYSRNGEYPKHSFRFLFREDYGDAKLHFPMFGDQATDVFNVLDLQTAQGPTWSNDTSFRGDQHTLIRDIFSRDMQEAMGHRITQGRYHHLFLNGVYWGIYLTQERVQEDFAETYYGGHASDYDVLKTEDETAHVAAVEGNDLAWRQLFDYGEALAADPVGNANLYWTMQGLHPDGTRDESLPVLLDVENLIDYMLVIFYTGGYDIGVSSFLQNRWARNWLAIYNRETADQGFQFFIHDNEFSMGTGQNALHQTLYIDRTGPFRTSTQSAYSQSNPQFLHQDLLDHPDYKQKFIDRVQKHFFNGGALTQDELVAGFLERKYQVEGGIIAEAARWGDSKTAIPRTKATWDAEVGWILDTYFAVRGPHVLHQLRGDGLHNNFAAPVFSQHGGVVTRNYPLTIAASGGIVYYSLDGVTDPRTIGGGVNTDPAVSLYNGPIVLEQGTTIMARLRHDNGQWSGLVEATFQVVNAPGDYDGSGTVDTADYQIWKSNYGQSVAPYSGADGNGDGVINTSDFLVWRNNLGNSLPPAIAAPQGSPPAEPATLVVAPATSPALHQPKPTRTAPRGQLADAALEATPGDGNQALLLLSEGHAPRQSGGDWRPTRREPHEAARQEALEQVFASLDDQPWALL